MSTTHCLVLLHDAVILWKYFNTQFRTVDTYFLRRVMARFLSIVLPMHTNRKIIPLSPSELRHNASWTGYTFASTLQAIDFNYKIIILIIVSIKTLFNCIITGESAVALPKNDSKKKGSRQLLLMMECQFSPRWAAKLLALALFCLCHTKKNRHDEKRQFLISFWLMMMNPIRH